MKKPALSIVLPCYNEADNLPMIFQGLGELSLLQDYTEIILVNNGSIDHSSEIMQDLCTHYPCVRVVNIAVNRGYGYGIMEGVRSATGEYIAWTHADLQTDPKDVLDAFAKIKHQVHPEQILMKGLRRRRSFVDSFFTFGMSIISSVAMRGVYYDINAQPKLFHRNLVQHMEDPPDDFSLDLYLLHIAKKKRYRLMTHPVYFHDRVHGEAKGGGTMEGKWKLIKRTARYILALQSRKN